MTFISILFELLKITVNNQNIVVSEDNNRASLGKIPFCVYQEQILIYPAKIFVSYFRGEVPQIMTMCINAFSLVIRSYHKSCRLTNGA